MKIISDYDQPEDVCESFQIDLMAECSHNPAKLIELPSTMLVLTIRQKWWPPNDIRH